MNNYQYLIIGGGMAAAAAMAGIREVDEIGSIGVFSGETHHPYDRPPLSKKLWTGDTEVDDIMRDVPNRVDFHLENKVQSLNLANKSVVDAEGRHFTFKKLLLATGGTPRQLPFGGESIIYYRTLTDYHRLRELAQKQERFAVIGGSFIGSEIAAALSMYDKDVTMLFPEAGICRRLFPADISDYLNQYYRDKGVDVLPETKVVDVQGEGNDLAVVTEDGRKIKVNAVVAGIGIEPNVSLAKAAGLNMDDGIVVYPSLQTSHPDVYAAGDVASFHDQVLKIKRRVEHEDNANNMGKAAGRSMAGAYVRYDYSPMFYSDMFDLGYEAVGQLDSELETVTEWEEPYQKGVIYYLADQRVRGVLLWNVWDQVNAARSLIASNQIFKPESLTAKIG